METGQLHSSVAIFRLRCIRLLAIWARQWLATKNPTDVARWVTEVESAFFAIYRRTPTIAEWVGYVLYLSYADPGLNILRLKLAARNLPVEPKFAAMLPFRIRLHHHKGDMDAALQEWSRQVGVTFAEMWTHRLHSPLPADRDWTDETVIKDYVLAVKSERRFFLTRLKHWCKLLKHVIRREHLCSES